MNRARLAKVWKLTTSPNAGEAAAALNRARIIVEREGKTLADVPVLLGQRSAQKPTPAPGNFTFYNMNDPAHRAAYAEHDRRRSEARARREEPERAEVLARYGSLDAVLAWTEQERLLRASVAQWSVFRDPPDERWTYTIDGHHCETHTDPPARVTRALSDAYPLPTTITEAAAEYAMWQKRDRDLGLALQASDDSQLDLPAYLRRNIVCKLLETGLRARSLAEVVIRQRYLVDCDTTEPEIEKAVLLDLEALVARGVPQSGRGKRGAVSRRSHNTRQSEMFGWERRTALCSNC